MSTTREVHLAARPVGEPVAADFAVVEVPLREPGPGQVLVRNTWLSVDPYMRGRMNDTKSYVPPFRIGAPLDGGAIGEVIASASDAVPVGATVLHGAGWREHALIDADSTRVIDAGTAPVEAYLGPLGMTGLTAYAGLRRIAEVRPGETVFISGAAGAVGIVAARVARHLGAARIIGSAGGPEKAARLVDDFGYDVGLDYRSRPIGSQLAEAAPDGIDIYFDNVGGDHLQAAIDVANDHARFALCGAISGYNATEPVPGPSNLIQAVGKRLTLRGFIVSDHSDLAAEHGALATGWLADGSLRFEPTVLQGFDQTVSGFLGLLRGANTGKMLIRL